MTRPPPGLLGTALPALVPAAGPDEAHAIAAAGALPLLLPPHLPPGPAERLPPFALDAAGVEEAALEPFRRLRQPPFLLLDPAAEGPAGFPLLIRRVAGAATPWHAATDAVLVDAGEEDRTIEALAAIRAAHPHLPLLAALADPAAIHAALAAGAAAIFLPFGRLAASGMPRRAPGTAGPIRPDRAAALRMNLRRRKNAPPGGPKSQT